MNQQLKRIRYQVMPVVTMLLAVAATAFLWHRHSSSRDVVGEVRMNTATASSLRDGVLLRQGHARLYQAVSRDEVVARLDSNATQADLLALHVDVERLRKEMPAEPSDPVGRLAWTYERLRMDELLQSIAVETDRLIESEASALYKAAVNKDEGTAGEDASTLKENHDAAKEKRQAEEKALAALTKRKLEARAAYEAKKDALPPAVLSSLTPVRDALQRFESRLADLKNQASSLLIRSPIDGKVVAVQKHPGQTVAAGEAVMTIAETNGKEIIAYVRQEQNIQPNLRDAVRMRSHSGGPAFMGKVDRVGPALQPVPLHQLRNSKVEEWGVPVTIILDAPNNAGQRVTLKPGELVDVKFGVSAPEQQ